VERVTGAHAIARLAVSTPCIGVRFADDRMPLTVCPALGAIYLGANPLGVQEKPGAHRRRN